MGAGNVSLIGAFVAGLLSFLSPCVLPLTPIYVAQLTGPAIWQTKAMSAAQRGALRRVTMLHAASFVAGFAVTFIAFGATASELGSFLSTNEVLLRQIGGVVLVLLGLHVAGVFQIPFLNRERRFSFGSFRARKSADGTDGNDGRSYPASFLIGLIFALGWTPCVGPILGGILLLAAQAQTLGAGVLLLAVYSLGLGIPFLLLGVAFDSVAPLLKRLTPHMRTVEIVTGVLLMLMGVVIFFNWLLIINSKFVIPGIN